MPEPAEKSYAENVAEVEEILRKLQSCADVDAAMEMFARGTECLEECERRLRKAQGRFQEISTHAERVPGPE